MKKGLLVALLLTLLAPVLSGQGLPDCTREWPSPGAFVNGNTNGDDDGKEEERLDLSDAIWLLEFLFLGGDPPVPLGCDETGELSLWLNGDVNGDWQRNVSDAVYLLTYLFSGGPEPVNPCYDGPLVLPPHARPYGLSLGEWGTLWWQWAYCIPCTEKHPGWDKTGEFCDTEQSGPTFFLVGNFVDNKKVERFCVVPFGKSIFFPVLNVECSTVEGPPFGCVEHPMPDELGCVECAEALLCPDDLLTCTINGEKIDNLHGFRAASRGFELTLPPVDSCLGVPDPEALAGADGYWIFLAPPPRGDYEIHFTGEIRCGPAIGFSLDVTYVLSVE